MWGTKREICSHFKVSLTLAPAIVVFQGAVARALFFLTVSNVECDGRPKVTVAW
jgi:hypothetical protein